MQLSFTIVAFVAAAASVTNAAVIPRANVNAGLSARYYTNELFPREPFAEVPGVAPRAIENDEPRNRARDYLFKRTPEPAEAKVAPRFENRRVHARDFRVGRVAVYN